MDKKESNYEVMKKQMQKKFASYDMETVAEEWGLKQDDIYLYADFVGRSYQMERMTGIITYEENGIQREADYNVSMTLFDILTRKHQYSSGIFKPANSFSKVHLAAPAGSSGGLFQKHVKFFDQKNQELTDACKKLGGIPYGKGDVGYRIPVFKDLDIVIQFYDSDDEFDADLTLFCDNSILQFMHFETMMFMLIHVIERLHEQMENKM